MANTTTKVKCVVDTCVHYGVGDVCEASAIEVTGRQAKSARETDCSTFETKGTNMYGSKMS